MKNILYAFISCLLVTFILFMLFTNLELFKTPLKEGNVSKRRQQAKAAAKSRQTKKRQEKTICIGRNCSEWEKNKDILRPEPDTVMSEMRRSLYSGIDNEPYYQF